MDTAAYAVDTQFYTRRVTKVEPLVQPHGAPMAWWIQCDGDWITCEDFEGVGIPPNVGEWARFYGEGVGYPVRGIVVGARVYRYQSQTEVRRQAEAALVERRAAAAARFEAQRVQFEQDVAALPEPLRQRMARLMENPEWAPEFGAYELFVCQEAALFAEVLKTPEAVKTFSEMSVDAQVARVSAMSEGHSAATFRAACSLAYTMLQAPVSTR